ncbi:MAG: YifB family Mg chelatase-like AAA ATPase [Eubacterium sp.]|uniref:YifB family Mg chelatase-like AAA ATPase n=1 Tax=Eubacterium sp. TaxID=142586 RepID=UPI003A31A8F6
MFAKAKSLGVFGMDAFCVVVEADISVSLPRFDIVGLPDAAVKESKERVRASIKNCGYDYPVSKITVNIAPADIKKEGPIYDLPILIALLKASRQIEGDIDGFAFVGELSLDGEIRPCNGILPMLLKAREEKYGAVFVPFANSAEASVVDGIDVFPVKNIGEVINHLNSKQLVEPCYRPQTAVSTYTNMLDFADVKGQEDAKRALEIAAAGGHNCIMAGPPGTGKSMLAKRLPSILPEMTFEEELETTKIYSIAGELGEGVQLIASRPFRSPHHTISAQGLAGGGQTPRPGEISLAHNGVLFMDEFPEFDRRAKEALRQPLEDGKITIARSSGTVSYPSNIMLVAAMNPCPCGYSGHPTKECTCTEAAKKRYRDKISGPLLDRIDIHIEVEPVDYDKLSSKEPEETSAEIRKRVNRAREIQRKRFEGTGITCNAKMTPEMTKRCCVLTDDASELLRLSFERLGLSARAYDKILRIARTIADLDESENIEMSHVAQAVQYRSLDRKYSL